MAVRPAPQARTRTFLPPPKVARWPWGPMPFPKPQPFPKPLATTDVVSAPVILSFPECHLNGILQNVVVSGFFSSA